MISEEIMSIPEGSGENENMRPHIENIKFMKALYGHCAAYVDCLPQDRGAFNIPGTNKWITELDVKAGSNWQVRHAKLQFMDWLHSQKISPDFLQKCRNELFPPKKKWIVAIDMDSFNYLPKQISEQQFEEAEKEGHTLYDSEDIAQKECNNINSL